ncbi:MAG: B12-binding domain-containing protein [Phycisphaerales bacterium]
MISEQSVSSFFEALIAGDRAKARQLVADSRKSGHTPDDLIAGLFWPTYNMIDSLYRTHRLGCLNHHMAVRLLRVLVDQNAALLNCAGTRNKSIFAVCGPNESEELAAQMALDVLEGAGYSVTFAGSRIANDEVLARVNDEKPDVLLLFASAAEDLPSIRALIDTIREIGSCPNMQIAVGGGVFNRAEGLAEEIGADAWATSPMELADVLIAEPSRRAISSQRTVGRTRKRRAA